MKVGLALTILSCLEAGTSMAYNLRHLAPAKGSSNQKKGAKKGGGKGKGKGKGNGKNKVAICHFDVDLLSFEKITVNENALKKYIGKYGPDIGYKDMTVDDANVLEGTEDCECITGYDGDGLNCYDINECDDYNDNNCGINSSCINIPGSFLCECDEGYAGDGMACIDIDECDLNTDNCSTNAACMNIPGSYQCECNPGYDGDGFVCSDIDECYLSTHNCDTNAACTNADGSFICTCNPGYIGNGETCTYSNEDDDIKVQYQESYPDSKYGDWTEKLQGVAGDDEYWYFTQLKVIWKVPITQNLDETKYMAKQHGVQRQEMPLSLQRDGYNHFGDISIKNGHIFVPIEHKDYTENAVLAVFTTDSLRFVGRAEFERTHAGWCAVGNHNQLFTSDNEIGAGGGLDVYSFDWGEIENGNDFQLMNYNPNGYKLEGIPEKWGGLSTYMQGGAFSTDGQYLFLMNGRLLQTTSGRGIWVFRNEGFESGHFVTKSYSTKEDDTSTFKYQYEKTFEEPEGLAFFDYENPLTNEITQLHAILLKPTTLFESNRIWLKHYTVDS